VKNVSSTAQMKGFVNVTSGDIDALKAAISAHGPVSVAIDASHRSLSFYANGVYYEPKCGKSGHLTHNFTVRIMQVKLLRHGKYTVSQKNCTPKAGRHKFIKITSPIMIFHTRHRHSVAD